MTRCTSGSALVLAALLATSCSSSDATSVLVTVSYQPEWSLSRFDVTVGELPAAIDVAPQFRVLLPDEWAGRDLTLEVWGMQGETRWAHGSATVAVIGGHEVAVPVALARTACDAACDTPPARTCVDASTLLVHDAQGICVDGSCEYPSREIACPNCPDCDACAPVTCTTPPAPTCVSATTRRTYASVGTCADGECTYAATDESCTEGCAGGACLPGTCTTGSWSITDVTAVTSTYSNGAMAIDATGGLHVSYRSWSDLAYARKPAGGDWTSADVVTVGTATLPTAIAVDANGRVHVAFYNGASGTVDYAYKPAGGSFTVAEVAVRAEPTEASSNQITIGIAVDSSRGVHLAYVDEVNESVRYATKPFGGTWSFTTVEARTAYGLAIAVDAADGVHLSYVTIDALRYAHKPAGGSWATATVDPSATFEPTSIKVDGAGVVHLAYFGAWPQPVPARYARKPVAGGWSTETIWAGDNMAGGGMGCSLGLDSGGRPHVAFTGIKDDDLHYGHRTAGGSWVEELVDSIGIVGSYPALAIDGADGVHVIYEGPSSSPMRYAYLPCD